MTEFDLTPPSSAQRDAIIAGLTADEHDVLLEHGTEAAFCGVFLDNHKDGVYTKPTRSPHGYVGLESRKT